TKPSTTKKTTKPYTQPTTKYVAPTTEYVAPTTQYVAPTTQYVAPTTQYVAPTTKYVAPSSNRLTASEVSKMSKTEIQNKINDIYASYGYIFKTKSIQAYYESQSWYVPRYNSETTVESLFSADDNYNKNLLAQYR
ncbi:YARHG domain-containing protein, partial [Ruminococcus sp.]